MMPLYYVLSFFCHTKLQAYQQLYERDDSDEEDIFGVYAKNLPISLVYEIGTSTEKHEQ
jgi:hypothetical protein